MPNPFRMGWRYRTHGKNQDGQDCSDGAHRFPESCFSARAMHLALLIARLYARQRRPSQSRSRYASPPGFRYGVSVLNGTWACVPRRPRNAPRPTPTGLRWRLRAQRQIVRPQVRAILQVRMLVGFAGVRPWSTACFTSVSSAALFAAERALAGHIGVEHPVPVQILAAQQVEGIDIEMVVRMRAAAIQAARFRHGHRAPVTFTSSSSNPPSVPAMGLALVYAVAFAVQRAQALCHGAAPAGS